MDGRAVVKDEAASDRGTDMPTTSDPDFDGLEALANAAENNPSEEVTDDQPTTAGRTSTPNTVEDVQTEDTPFMQEYRRWYKKHHQEEFRAPKFNRRDFSIERLWNVVLMYGGSQQVCREKAWAKIGRQFNPPKSMTNLSFHIKRLYERYLLAYEKEVHPTNAMAWQNPTAQKRFREENESSGESPNKRQFKGNAGEKWVHQSAVPLRGFQLVERRIKLWIPQEKDYMQANILSYNEQKDVYGLEYDDGFQEEVDLNLETWYLSSSESEGLAVQQFQKLMNTKGGGGGSNRPQDFPSPANANKQASWLANASNLLPSLGTEAAAGIAPSLPLPQPIMDLPLGNFDVAAACEPQPKLDFNALNLPLEGGILDNNMQQQQAAIETTQLILQAALNWKESDSNFQQRTLLDLAQALNEYQRKNDAIQIELKGKEIQLAEQKEKGNQERSELLQKIEILETDLKETKRLLYQAEAGQQELRNCFQMLLQTILSSGSSQNNNSGIQQHNRQAMGSTLPGGSGGGGGGGGGGSTTTMPSPQAAPLFRALMQVANFSSMSKPQKTSQQYQQQSPQQSQQQQHSPQQQQYQQQQQQQQQTKQQQQPSLTLRGGGGINANGGSNLNNSNIIGPASETSFGGNVNNEMMQTEQQQNQQ